MEKDLFISLNKLIEFNDNKRDIILNNLLHSYSDIHIDNKDKIDVSDDVYKDTLIDKWIQDIPNLKGSKILIKNIIRNPINNKDLLIDRQKSSIDLSIDFDLLSKYEDDLLWIFNLNEEIDNEDGIKMLFPSTFIISYINYIEYLLNTFHYYKIYFLPITSLLYPLSSIIAPLYYINTNLKLNISLKEYFNTLYNLIKFYFRSTGNFRVDLFKLIFFILYIILYLYNIYQTFEMSMMLYNIKEKLHTNMNGLVEFIKNSKYILKNISIDIIKPYLDIYKLPYNNKNIYDELLSLTLKNSMTDIYKLWKNDELKNKISSLLIITYIVDIIKSLDILKLNYNWCNVNFIDYDNTKIWNMMNPIISDRKQQSNPLYLNKSLIITGPNAAGKTTYVKSILSNILLAQTFGISNSIKANITIYDTINSFMRISDILGSKSYFEVEAEYCSNMIKKAEELQLNNKKGLFLMDEPMHSTPPIEGMSTAYAVAEYIGNMKNIKIILTTHFHKLVLLEDNYPKIFRNISVDAIKKPNNTFYFPYKIKKGSSFQCIAIELLNDKKFPDEVIDSAINMKNKICNENNK